MAKVPNALPQAKRELIEKIITANGLDLKKTPLILIGVRGYYLDSMGELGKNDRGDFDDAFFWITPNSFVAFNGNTDPSKYRKGKGTGTAKGMASLKEGVWQYKTGVHNGTFVHPAFRQYASVTVVRDGLNGDYEETGDFGINIHKAGPMNLSTSSLGCQTVPRSQWDSFKEFGYSNIKAFGMKWFPYILIAETRVRTGKLSINGKSEPVVIDVKPTSVKLAWESKLDRSVSDHLLNGVTDNLDVLAKAKDVESIFSGFSKLSIANKVQVISHFLVALAKFESSYNPKSYSVDVGTKNDKGSWSVGLYQLSANDNSAKKFKATFEMLQDPKVNITVMLEQMTKQIKKEGLFILPNTSQMRYWAIILKNNKYNEIESVLAEVKKNYKELGI